LARFRRAYTDQTGLAHTYLVGRYYDPQAGRNSSVVIDRLTMGDRLADAGDKRNLQRRVALSGR
jgi:hypothetical protein